MFIEKSLRVSFLYQFYLNLRDFSHSCESRNPVEPSKLKQDRITGFPLPTFAGTCKQEFHLLGEGGTNGAGNFKQDQYNLTKRK